MVARRLQCCDRAQGATFSLLACGAVGWLGGRSLAFRTAQRKRRWLPVLPSHSARSCLMARLLPQPGAAHGRSEDRGRHRAHWGDSRRVRLEEGRPACRLRSFRWAYRAAWGGGNVTAGHMEGRRRASKSLFIHLFQEGYLLVKYFCSKPKAQTKVMNFRPAEL